MRRESILLIWIGGIVLAVALYLIGPDRFLDALLNVFDTIDMAFHNLAFVLGAQAYGVVRALALAIYVVFAVLAVLASQRGHRGFWPLIIVSVLFLMLVWRPYEDGFVPISRWCAALLMVLVGAVLMSQRLTSPPPGPMGPPPYPMGRGR